MTWSDLANVFAAQKQLHDGAFSKSGTRHMRVFSYRPPAGAAQLIDLLAEYLPSKVLGELDLEHPWVLVVDLSGSGSAAVLVRGDVEVTWEGESIDLRAVVPSAQLGYALGTAEAMRRLLHRLAACAQVAPWYPAGYDADGGHGQPERIEFDADGRPTRTPWEVEA